MCPLSRWPPNSSPNLRARSTLTLDPGDSEPNVVLSSVSGMISKVTASSTEVAVRQTPSIETEAPISSPSVDGICIHGHHGTYFNRLNATSPLNDSRKHHWSPPSSSWRFCAHCKVRILSIIFRVPSKSSVNPSTRTSLIFSNPRSSKPARMADSACS